ncbi:hypothetical protein [Almyronema epifaneia]
MKRWIVGLSALAVAGVIPFVSSEPVRAQIAEVTDAIVEAIRRPEVRLTLSAEKQVLELDANGQEKISWEQLEGQVKVQPGDVLRYTVDGANSGDLEATNLVITQPVPTQTTYILDSAAGNNGAELTYSIDNGQTFVAEPMVEVTLADGTVELQPAPAEAYTHVKWDFADSLTAAETVKVTYEVTVD